MAPYWAMTRADRSEAHIGDGTRPLGMTIWPKTRRRSRARHQRPGGCHDLVGPRGGGLIPTARRDRAREAAQRGAGECWERGSGSGDEGATDLALGEEQPAWKKTRPRGRPGSCRRTTARRIGR